MADSELADLTAAATLASTDILYAVVDPAGSPLDRKVTVSTVQAAVVRQVLPTLDTSAQGWGLPGVNLTGAVGTASPGWDWRMFEVARPITVTAVMQNITTGPGADATIRFGIWAHDPATGKPGTLVNDFGTVAVLTAATGIHSVTGSVALTAGDYWVACRQSTYIAARRWTSTLRMVSSTANTQGPGGYGSPGTGAFGNAPALTVDTSGPSLIHTLMRWSPT